MGTEHLRALELGATQLHVPSSDIILIINITFSLLTYTLIALWYVVPRIREAGFARGIEPILLFHSTRHIGLFFLAPGAVKKTLPRAFSIPAAYGDFLAALLALVALCGVRMKSTWAKAMTWVFNVEGTVDLAIAILQGFTSKAQLYMGAAIWIPSVIVPALLVGHGLVFWMLLSIENGDGTHMKLKAKEKRK